MMAKASARLSSEQRDRVAQLVALKGLAQTARFLGMSARTVQVASLGGDIQDSTLALFEKRLAERDREGKHP